MIEGILNIFEDRYMANVGKLKMCMPSIRLELLPGHSVEYHMSFVEVCLPF